ncbi:hypothetical protein CK203_099960 [Vitis vinifera]|uniref:Reverse transcriptase Ty1/copia-type domain-containing protein n=1 Tax=Vitis vinifera TaxID=29760 RepID=A0A438CIR0_VITVI|nr:hypothetical protein CK203_099960 [Vitis vinifera]
MHSEFEMSMMGELSFFLGLQVKKLKEGTFINQAKYIRDLLKRFNMEESKTMKTSMSSFIKLEKDEKGKSIYSTMYRGMIGLWIGFLEDWRLRFQIWIAFSFSRVSQSVSVSVPLHFRTPKGMLLVEPSQPEARRKHFRFKGIFTRIGWVLVVTISELVFPTLVQAFYSRVNYGMGGPIISTVRGVEICLDLESIYHIFDIAPIGLRVYESNIWPTVLGFEPRETIQRICEHRDEVSYYEAFLIDSVLIGRRIHLGYLMMMHMISCCQSMTRVLPYGSFLTKVFKDVGVDLRPKWFLGKESRDNTCIGSGTGTEPELDIPPLQSMGVQFKASFSNSMMSELTYIISTLGTRIEELAVVSDTRFYSMEDRMDQYQANFTS